MPHACHQMGPSCPATTRHVATLDGRYVSFDLIKEARSHGSIANACMPNEDMERRTECAGI